MVKLKWKEEEIKDIVQRAVEGGESYCSIGKDYGVAHTTIRKLLIRLGYNINRHSGPGGKHKNQRKEDSVCENCGKVYKAYRTSFGKFCCNKCEHEFHRKQKYQMLIEGDESMMRANYSPKIFKQFILAEQDNKCAICGMAPEWNGKPLVFILDHIDGHASNNKRENLRCICPNCDSQLDTYKSRNKCGERSYYRYHKEEKSGTEEI